MTIKSSGTQLSFTEIEAEFGETDNRGLGPVSYTHLRAHET